MSELILGDCIEVMKCMEDKSIDMVLCDLPYGTTKCKWDTVIPFDDMWEQLNRISKDGAPIVLTAAQPFTSNLIMSNLRGFKYSMVWKKSKCGSPFSAKYRPMCKHEDILVFERRGNRTTYNPQMEIGEPYSRKFTPNKKNEMGFGIRGSGANNTGTRYPSTVLEFQQKWRRQDQLHTAQKPVELFEYLIKTYSNEGDMVFDGCVGSGTTAIACINTNREYTCVELDEGYFNVARDRIDKHISNDN